MATLYPPACTAASTALGYVLVALEVDGTRDLQFLDGLPDGLYLPEREAMLVATATPAPLFRKAAEQLAAIARLDVVLLRVGDRVDGALPVTADLTLAALPHAPWPMVDLSLWTGPAGQLWLVPFGFGASIAVTSEGLLLDMVPPYPSLAERKIGLARAAREIGGIFAAGEAR